MKFSLGIALFCGYICVSKASSKWVPEGALEDCGRIDSAVLKEADAVGSSPWQVSIYRRTVKDKEPLIVCSGSILKSHVIMTAAQCFRDWDDSVYTAVVGDYDISNMREESEQTFGIEKLDTFIHEKFNKDSTIGENDIAIVRLNKDIKFNKWVQPVCLPSKKLEYKPGNSCQVAGFGIPQRIVKEATKLKSVPVSLITDADCKVKYDPLRNAFKENSMFCTSGECQAMSGAPIVCEVNENNQRYFIQYGIVSFSKVTDCSSEKIYPTVGTKISNYVNWLEQNLASADIKITALSGPKW